MTTAADKNASGLDYVKAWPFYPLPQHAISRATYQLTRVEARWFKNAFIRLFAKTYNINWDEALLKHPEDFKHFNDFFTRELRPGVRPIEGDDHSVVSPADGRISQIGRIDKDAIFQAKGHTFSATELLGGDPQRAQPFQDGRFVTVYLSPRDYHRVHMPLAGTLQETVYIPGRLFSVAGHTVRTVPRLFARNERLAAIFDTVAGPMAMVLVGAMNVAAIETVWEGLVTPPQRPTVEAEDKTAANISLARGEEMGRFNMGSTVILLFGKDQVEWVDGLTAEESLRMGQVIGG